MTEETEEKPKVKKTAKMRKETRENIKEGRESDKGKRVASEAVRVKIREKGDGRQKE